MKSKKNGKKNVKNLSVLFLDQDNFITSYFGDRDILNNLLEYQWEKLSTPPSQRVKLPTSPKVYVLDPIPSLQILIDLEQLAQEPNRILDDESALVIQKFHHT